MARRKQPKPADIRSPIEKRDDALAKVTLYQDNVHHGWLARFSIITWVKVAIVGGMILSALMYFFYGLGLLGL